MSQSTQFYPTERDILTVLLVQQLGGLTAALVARRFYPSPAGLTACLARLARLVKAGYLVSRRLPSTNGIGSGKAFFTIGGQARPLLAKMLGISPSELAKSRADSPSYLAHHLALCATQIALTVACERCGCSLEEWTSERELRRLPLRVKDPLSKQERALPLIPDAAFTLGKAEGKQQRFFLEQDRGTLAPKRARTKLRLYLALGKQQNQQVVPVLFVVPDPLRQAAICRWAEEEAKKLQADPTIILVTTAGQLNEATDLSAPIWRVAGGPQALALVPASAPSPVRPPLSSPRHRPQPAAVSLVGGLAQ